ncbi:MAG: N-6 DNA methylase [Ignavibacteriae bacterium]|nr:N-6 DNA methylase [Ignavibacteriota bacterium]
MAGNNSQLEKRLWDAADQLRANSKLTSTEYSMPVLGLIFLRHAYNRYLIVEESVLKTLPVRQGKPRPITKDDFTKKSALFLNEESKYDFLLQLPGGAKIGDAIIKAMTLIETDYKDALEGILPKDYSIFEDDLLSRLLKIFNDDALKYAPGDVFGRIYEYFLMKFAMSGAQDSGEFFTPVSLVQTIVNVIEPNHDSVFDPACGSGGMFVQTAHFIEKSGKDISKTVTFYGQEKTDTTIKLAKMNLAVHGLEGKIENGNTFYDDNHEMFVKKADFVMANPPFNVNGVDADKVKTDPRLPFNLPGVNNKGEVSNGNYLWISYFYSYLNKTGRAGFVMSSQASSAGGGEKEVRRKIIETGHVDVMISIRSNFFYTRTVPCELWFFDKGKPKDRLDKILMIDARNIFRKYQDSRRIFEFSPEQLKNITAITWLYRSLTDKYLNLIKEYFESILSESATIELKVNEYNNTITLLSDKIKKFYSICEKNKDIDKDKIKILNEQFKELKDTCNLNKKDSDKLLLSLNKYISKYANKVPEDNNLQIKAYKEFEPISEEIKAIIKQIELTSKLMLRTIDYIEKDLKAKDIKEWDRKSFYKLKKEIEELRKSVIEQLKQPNYFHKQIHWLESKFPKAKYQDVEGLVKLVDKKEVEKNDWSLTPGRYVGVSPQIEDEDFDFEETMREIHEEINGLNEESVELARIMNDNFNILLT